MRLNDASAGERGPAGGPGGAAPVDGQPGRGWRLAPRNGSAKSHRW